MSTRPFLLAVAYVLILFGIWYLLKLIWPIPDFLLPWPTDVLAAVFSPQSQAIHHSWITFSESIAGFVLANVVAFAIALLFQFSALARHVLLPLAIALKATPIVALAPLILIWIGSGFMAKVVSSALVAFFPMLIGLYSAMNQIPQPLLDYAASLRATKWQTLVYVRLPHSVPEMFAALRVSSTLAVVGAVVAEFMAPTGGLGYLILTSSYQFETSTTFAAIFLTALTGILLYSFVGLIELLLPVRHWRT